jgi:glycosyltransferase involved in cell wall biosynthesis
MQKPFFSIVIPALNEEKFLPQLLTSLIHQTDQDFEVIVVDGRSKDKTIQVAEAFKEKIPRLQVMKSPRTGLPFQRNYGAEHGAGKWFIFFDADDVLLPYCIERCKSFIETHQKTKFFTSWFMPDSEVSGDALLTLLAVMFFESGKLVKRQIAPGPFAAIRRDIFASSGGYDANRAYGEDQEYSMRLYEHGIPLDVLRETLYVYSFRRFRKKGTLTMFQTYAKNALIALITKRAPKTQPGYIMGGHVYTSKKKQQKINFKLIEQKLNTFFQEMFN